MQSTRTPLRRSDALVAIGLAALVCIAGSWRMAPGVAGIYHDDAIYVSTARALADGDGYRLTGVPGEPLQTKYPIVYPAMLAAVAYFSPSFPESVAAMQFLTLLIGATAVAVSYLYLVRFGYFTRGVATAAGIICGTSPYFLYFCTITMAEMPFLLLTVGALWGLDRQLRRDDTSAAAEFGLGCLVALPFLCRTIGAIVVPVAIWLLFRSGRRVRWCLAGAALAALPWIAWSLMGRGIWDRNPIDGYYTDYVGCWSSTGLQLIGRVFSINALLVAFGSGDLACEGLSAAMEPTITTGLRVWLLVVVGMIPWLMIVPQVRIGKALPCFLGVYLLAMLFWPWPPQRFLIPILPFVIAYVLTGFMAIIGGLLPSLGRNLVALVLVCTVVLANLMLLAKHTDTTAETGYPVVRLADAGVRWEAYQRTLTWLCEHTCRDDVVASGLDSMISLYADCKSFRPFAYNPGRLFYGEDSPQLTTVDELMAVLTHFRPRYLVLTPMPGFAEEKPLEEVVEQVQKLQPELLKKVYQDADPRFKVFEFATVHQQPSPGIVAPGLD